MIHQVFLPEITRKRLTDVVALQVLLLTYAATRDTLNEASCTTYLDRCARFRGRGAQIAAWIWRAPSRYEPLGNLRKGLRRISLGGVNALPVRPSHSCNILSVILIPIF